ncbi:MULTISPECIES: hypothetical protein [Myxococcus]|uniref:hypothetical protein n=1 Tax=Myxococcus TaxID=32 RepID=UPI00112CDD6B|nr:MULTISPECIES: hypothetical protein [Myxococcus]QDE84438.1 hypothetical protein BHS07_24370 [Myxococcus xanthus]WAM23886.1 hypothetical protein OZ403_25435 [Myxococcus sp. NMCA1]
MKRTLQASAVALSLLAGCATVPKPSMCFAEAGPNARSFPTPDTWFALLLHGYDKDTGANPRPSVDCAGAPVWWQDPAADECVEAGPDSQALPPAEKLSEEDLVLETLQAGQRLVWVQTRRFTNGEALGPVALVETTEQGFRVEALGSLRAMAKHTKLRLEKVKGTQILVAEGDACTSGDEEVCRRHARIMPLRTNRFFSESVSNASRACLGAAWFPLSREMTFELPNGLRRKFELTSTLTFAEDGISVQEQVQVSDSDPAQPDVAPRLYRRAQDTRALELANNALVGNKASLWSRMVEQQVRIGARAVPEAPIWAMPAKKAPTDTAAPEAASTAKAPATAGAASPPAKAAAKKPAGSTATSSGP